MCWQRSSSSSNIWRSWASWTSHVIYLSTQTRRRWHVSFLVLKGMRHWADDCYPCDCILTWVLHTNICSWSQAGNTAKTGLAHSSPVVSPYICARKSDFNCRAEAQFGEQRAHAITVEKKRESKTLFFPSKAPNRFRIDKREMQWFYLWYSYAWGWCY